jgi:hypothetical protein
MWCCRRLAVVDCGRGPTGVAARSQIEATKILERSLITAASVLGVREEHGQW